MKPKTSEGPLSKGARTRERILATAGDLFHQQGINATSLGQVLRASHTGQGQFYQHFTGRNDLVQQVLRRYRIAFRGLPSASIDTWDDLQRWMEAHVERQQSFGYVRGCPVGTAAYALQPNQEEERAELKRIFDEMRRTIITFLRREQQAGRLRSEADPRRLADFFVACVQGGMLLSLLERGPRPVRSAINEGFAHLRSYTLPLIS